MDNGVITAIRQQRNELRAFRRCKMRLTAWPTTISLRLPLMYISLISIISRKALYTYIGKTVLPLKLKFKIPLPSRPMSDDDVTFQNFSARMNSLVSKVRLII